MSRYAIPLLAFLMSGVALAQDRRDVLNDIERERAIEWREEQLRRDAKLAPAKTVQWLPPIQNEAPCFVIDSVELRNDSATRAQFSWLLADINQFAGACLGEKSIDRLRRNLDARLMARGFVTSSVEIPPQQLKDGVLSVELHLGRLASIDYRGQAGAVVLPSHNALALKTGEVLNLRDIEQTLENLARLPSQAGQFQIAAAEAPDQSALLIAFPNAKPWRIGASLDNSAAREFGKWQLSVQGVLDAPLGLSDQLALSFSRSLRSNDGTRHVDSVMVAYSVPLAYHLFSLSGSRSTHARPIQSVSTRFEEHGFDTNVQARWLWTPWRSAGARLSVWAAASQRKSRNYVEDVELVLQRRHSRRLEWGSSYWQRVSEADELAFDYEASRARPVSLDTDFVLAPPPLPRTSQLRLGWTHWLGAAQPGNAWQYETRLSWQSVREPASGSDLHFLGSRWSVRGFDAESFLSGQEMTLWRQDLRSPWRAVGAGHGQVFLGLDAGKVGAGEPSTTGVLGGTAIGARWRGRFVGAELTLASPVHKPAGFAAQSWVTYFNFNVNY